MHDVERGNEGVKHFSHQMNNAKFWSQKSFVPTTGESIVWAKSWTQCIEIVKIIQKWLLSKERKMSVGITVELKVEDIANSIKKLKKRLS